MAVWESVAVSVDDDEDDVVPDGGDAAEATDEVEVIAPLEESRWGIGGRRSRGLPDDVDVEPLGSAAAAREYDMGRAAAPAVGAKGEDDDDDAELLLERCRRIPAAALEPEPEAEAD